MFKLFSYLYVGILTFVDDLRRPTCYISLCHCVAHKYKTHHKMFFLCPGVDVKLPHGKSSISDAELLFIIVYIM